MATLKLGNFDSGKKPTDLRAFLKLYHTDGVLRTTDKFRDDDNNRFVEWQEGENIQELQEFLCNAGFMVKKYNEGVFDYVTEAAVRLFQEYIRTVDPADSSFVRDGKVGNGTWAKIKEWPEGKKCEWDLSRAQESSTHEEYNNWFKLLTAAKEYYSIPENQGPIMKAVNAMSNTESTLKVGDWKFDKNRVHLIGIRRNESVASEAKRRKNDDLFILLMNGMVFKFWGSTDPQSRDQSQNTSPNKDEPYLVEGQHVYRFGWHKLGEIGSNAGKYASYRALRPAINQKTVVIRDWKRDNRLSEEDLIKNNGLGYGTYINIHWTGGRSNNTWSAGCQVIRAHSYMNHRNEAIDLSKFSASSYEELYRNDKLDKGAYNMLADLVVCNTKIEFNPSTGKPKPQGMYYTLVNENEALPIASILGENYVINALKAMKVE